MRALVLLNQPVTLDWKLLNLETKPFTVPFMLANISRTSLNYYFVTYSVLSSWGLVGGGGGGTGSWWAGVGLDLAIGWSGVGSSIFLGGNLAVWMN